MFPPYTTKRKAENVTSPLILTSTPHFSVQFSVLHGLCLGSYADVEKFPLHFFSSFESQHIVALQFERCGAHSKCVEMRDYRFACLTDHKVAVSTRKLFHTFLPLNSFLEMSLESSNIGQQCFAAYITLDCVCSKKKVMNDSNFSVH